MNKSAIVVLLVLSFSLGLFGQENEVKLQNSDSELTDEIIRQAFSQLGLTMFSFSCDIKSGDDITFSVEQFKNGKEKDSYSIGKLEAEENISPEITIFIHKVNNQIRFTQMHQKTNETGSQTGRAVSIKGYNATSSYSFGNPVLKSGEKAPVYIIAMNKGNITSRYFDEQINEMVKKYDMVFIVYITLNEEKNYDLSK